MIVQPERIDITLADRSKSGGYQRGVVSWIKAIIGAGIVLGVLVAILLLGIALGTILAILTGTLVVVALVVLVLRWVLSRSRMRQAR